MSSYWFSQAIYYFFYSVGGLPGIFVMRCILFAGLLYFMAKREHGDHVVFAGLLMIFSIVVLRMYPLERPQVFSFLGFSILLFMLEKITRSETRPSYSVVIMVSLLMLVWANLHAGFIIGQGILILYPIAEGIKFIHPLFRPLKKEVYNGLFMACSSGLIFSLINPNSYHVVIEYFKMSLTHASFITDYVSTMDYFAEQREYAVILYWLLGISAVAGFLRRIDRADISAGLILAGTGYFSFYQVRYIPFFLIAALPSLGRYCSGTKYPTIIRSFVLSLAIISAAFFAWNGRENLKAFMAGQFIDADSFPLSAAEFVVNNNLQGNMYNYYDYGGYLIWRCSPGRRVFIDGRVLSEHVFLQTNDIDGANAVEIMGKPLWKSTLDAYAVKYIITRYFFSNTDKVIPLVTVLLDDSEWVPVFLDNYTLVFVRNVVDNEPVVKAYSIPKSLVREQINLMIERQHNKS
ncbi:MAG: hypothetical protein C0402_11245 [Thermodesulfovibrio sp.]|nr:hypothetical protein [Thermodesulfovibrio sp.]